MNELVAVVRVLASLAVVVVLVVVVARIARRAGTRGPGAGLAVVDRIGVSREAAVAVVEVAGQVLVLGVTANSVRLLTQLEPAALQAFQTQEQAQQQDREQGLDDAPARPAGTGSVLDPRTWQQAVDALRELTVRRR